MSARSNSGSTSWKDVVLAESQRLDGVLVEMEGGVLVRGTVSGLPAARLGGISIFASGRDYEDSATTGDDGRFTLRDVPAGVVQLQASVAFPSRRSVSKNLEIPDGAAEVVLDGKRFFTRILYLLPDKTPIVFVLIPKKRDHEPETFYMMVQKVWIALFRKFAAEKPHPEPAHPHRRRKPGPA